MAGMAWRSGSVTVRAPATSANLGPGFDAFGLALGLYDEVTARVVADGVTVAVTGEGAGDLPADGTHLVARSMLTAFDLIGSRPGGFELTCVNQIPQARGLGSSSAAIVSGVLLARALLADGATDGATDGAVDGAVVLDDAAVLRLCAEIEGHPDNVAPCLLGGFTIAWTEAAGARAVRLTPVDGIRPVVFVPAQRGLTDEARAALPAQVPHRDAAHAVGRAALLVHALTARPDLLLSATEDRLHQPYRATVAPQTAELVGRLRADGVPAVVSGAGPSVLALVGADWTAPQPAGWQVRPVEMEMAGAVVTYGQRSGILGHAERDPVAAGRAR
jgi:homoserine kinase